MDVGRLFEGGVEVTSPKPAGSSPPEHMSTDVPARPKSVKCPQRQAEISGCLLSSQPLAKGLFPPRSEVVFLLHALNGEKSKNVLFFCPIVFMLSPYSSKPTSYDLG